MRDNVTMPEFRSVQKLPMTPMLHLPEDKGFSVNLLANSLTNKLRLQRKTCSPVKQNKGSAQTHHGGNSVEAKVAKSILAHKEKRRLSRQTLRTERSDDARTASVGGESSTSQRKQSNHGRSRIDSAASDRFPEVTTSGRKRSGELTEWRSNSASPVTARSGRLRSSTTPSYRSHAGSVLSGSAPTFESRGPGRSVMVIKRDGVFQPFDKYAPARQMIRETAPVGKLGVACEYEMYNICDDSLSAGSLRGRDDPRKSLKVSWSQGKLEAEIVDHESAPGDSPDVRSAPTTAQGSMRRALSVDNFAFRKPVYSTGRSQVASLGVKWTLPTIAKDEEDSASMNPPSTTDTADRALATTEEEPASKQPMWSWLVTQESKKPPCPPPPPPNARGSRSSGSSPRHVQGVGSVSQKQSSGGGTSSTSSFLRHRRDLHPVSTAMNRDGTSVSRTKWHVPGSTSGKLDAERAIYGRLELVKRPGSQMLYDTSGSMRMPVGTTDFPMSRPLPNGGSPSPTGKTMSKTNTKTINQSELRDECQEGSQNNDVDSMESTYTDDDRTLSPTKSRYT